LFILLTISDEGRSAIRYIFDKYHKRMLYMATQILGKDRAEEAVHDVFVKLIEKFEKNFEILGDKPGQYFVIIIRNHSLNIVKKDRLDTVPLDEDHIDDDIFCKQAVDPEEALLDAEATERLVSLIRRLTPATRQVLEYKYIEGYSNIEIAGMLDISQSAVSTRIDKAKKRLKDMLDREEGADNGN